jgi:hypothetical protein
MAEEIGRGNLVVTPFPRLLFRIWEKQDSGRLSIRTGGFEKSVFLIKGDLALVEGHFSGELFLKSLLSAQVLTALQAEKCSSDSRENKISYPRSLIEQEIASPSRVWGWLTEFWMEEIWGEFDRPRADLTFQLGMPPQESQVYAIFPTPTVILDGIRRMKNHSLIEAALPKETEFLQLLSPTHANHFPFAPHEKHVLRMLRQSPRLGDLYALSQIGKRETQKALFAFLTLGLAGVSPAAGAAKAPPELSSAGLEKIWSGFNDKCSYIYKYISKEIGPVGLSVLEKALEEVRARLAPPFGGLELQADGRIELGPFPLKSLPLVSEETRKNFIRLLNEVLVAEVLAVKKALGNAHEAAVIRNLEKMGEPG